MDPNWGEKDIKMCSTNYAKQLLELFIMKSSKENEKNNVWDIFYVKILLREGLKKMGGKWMDLSNYQLSTIYIYLTPASHVEGRIRPFNDMLKIILIFKTSI